jgi:hypothetical protein
MGKGNLRVKLESHDTSIADNSNKIGDLSGNGISENNLALAIKNDRSQLAEMPTQSFITEKEKTVDVNVKLALKADNSVVALKAEKSEVLAVSNQIANIVANNGNGVKDVELVDLRTGADGLVYASAKARADAENNKIPYKNLNSAGFNNSTPIGSYPLGATTIMYFGISSNSGFPSSHAGILQTINFFNVSSDTGFQIWYPYNSNKIFKRRCISSVWQEWVEITITINMNAYSSSDLATSFPANKVTYSSTNLSGGVGFPGNTAGLLITYRFNTSGSDRQEFKPYNQNLIWTRYTQPDGSWSSWEEFGEVEKKLINDIRATKQSIIFNTDGTVQKIQHKDVNLVVLREDVFTYTTNLITEVRTLSTGRKLTFKFNLTTLETEVI